MITGTMMLAKDAAVKVGSPPPGNAKVLLMRNAFNMTTARKYGKARASVRRFSTSSSFRRPSRTQYIPGTWRGLAAHADVAAGGAVVAAVFADEGGVGALGAFHAGHDAAF